MGWRIDLLGRPVKVQHSLENDRDVGKGIQSCIGLMTNRVVIMPGSVIPGHVVNTIQCIYESISKAWRKSTMEA